MVHICVCIIAGNDSILLASKQIIGISLCYLLYYNLLREYEVEYIFKIYYLITFGFALIGVAQELSAIFRIGKLYDLSFVYTMRTYSYMGNTNLTRISCLFEEPSFVAITMAPAVYKSISMLLFRHKDRDKTYNFFKAITIIACYVCTFSTVAYIGICMMIIMHIGKKILRKETVVVLGVLCVAFYLMYTKVDYFKIRIDDTIGVFLGDSDINNSNLSLIFS